jgi:hypothetical protein
MKAAAAKYRAVSERLGGPMTRAQALRLKGLAGEAYQPERYAADLSSDEAPRRRCAQGGDRAGEFLLRMWEEGATTFSCGRAPDRHACGCCRPS